MNESLLRVDLREYVRGLWRSKRLIFGGTAASVLIMAAFTWAVPRLYAVTARIDAGSIAVVQPERFNLFLEAVDRNEFVVAGAMFTGTSPKALMVRFKPASTIDLDILTRNPADAVARLPKLADGVVNALNIRLDEYVQIRRAADDRAAMARKNALAQWTQLRQMIVPKGKALDDTIRAARADETRAAARRAALVAAASRRVERLLAQDSTQDSQAAARQIESAVAPLRDADDAELARAAETRRAAEEALARHQLALSKVEPGPTAPDAATAGGRKERLLEVASSYAQNDADIAQAAGQAATALAELEDAYRGVQGPPLSALRQAAITIGPSLPLRPAWPRPVVNLTIACLFGFAASLLAAGFRMRTGIRPDSEARSVP